MPEEVIVNPKVVRFTDVFDRAPGIVPESPGGVLHFLRADGTWAEITTPGSKGDITYVSESEWNINPGAVTQAHLADEAVVQTAIKPGAVSTDKLAEAPTLTIKGNPTGSSAKPVDITIDELKVLLGIS